MAVRGNYEITAYDANGAGRSHWLAKMVLRRIHLYMYTI